MNGNESLRRPLTTKVHFYQALYALNRGFEITLLGVKRLEELGVFQGENLIEYEEMLELTRAEINEELAGTLQGYEEDDSNYWGRRYDEREKQLRDPDDVFFAARDRKLEIKERMKELQAGLDRQRPKRARSKRRSSKPGAAKRASPKRTGGKEGD